jgi:hypothetical protein
MTRAGCFAIALVWLLLSSTTSAQNSSGFGTGTSRIVGQVVAADTGAPLPGAQVTIAVDDILSSRVRSATADASGVFDFSDLPSGRYRLTASKAGYLLPARQSTAGVRVDVARGQFESPVTIAMTRGAALTGRLVDAAGEPVAAAQVSAERYQYVELGNRTTRPAGADRTDDLGQFRIYGLPAGDYIVAATIRDAPGVNFFYGPGAGATYATTFFPGTIHPAEAQTISLTAGQESAAHFTLIQSRLVRITGTAFTAAGAPAVGLQVRLRAMTTGLAPARALGTVSQDGTFEVSHVPPGEFWVTVCCGKPGTAREAGSVPVTVSAEDVSGVAVVTTPGTMVRGSVVFEPARPESTFQLRAMSAEGPSGVVVLGNGFDAVDSDGGFSFAGLSGRVFFQPVNGHWTIKSIVLDGKEIVDEPLDLSGKGAVTGLRVTVTDRQTHLLGVVKDDRGHTMAEQLVVLMRADGAPALPGQRIRTVRTDDGGRFHLVGMRPGAYVVGVVDDLEPGYHFSPDFQERLRTRGRSFSLDAHSGQAERRFRGC